MTPTEWDPVHGKFVRVSRERIFARHMTRLLMQRHWIAGIIILVPVIIWCNSIRMIFLSDDADQGERADVNEPVGAVISTLGAVYGLVFVFAFQGSRERILSITEAIHVELSALQKLQLLAQSGALATHLAEKALRASLAYSHTLAAELKPDDWTFGNRLYSVRQDRGSLARQRDRALFGMEPLRKFRDLCASAVEEAHSQRAAAAASTSYHEADGASEVAAEVRGLVGHLVDGRNKRLAYSMHRMPLAEWCLLETGTYTFIVLLALLDTGSIARDRALIGTTGFMLIVLNHLVADANEPFNGSFKVKKALVMHFIEAAQEATALGPASSQLGSMQLVDVGGSSIATKLPGESEGTNSEVADGEQCDAPPSPRLGRVRVRVVSSQL